MTTTLETIITRPSLDDVFFFESIIEWNLTNEHYLDKQYDSYIESMGSGFISTELEVPITWEEIERRRSELRPDLVEMLKYKRPLEPFIDHHTSNSVMWVIGPKGEPPFNPFSLTYKFYHHYETYDQLISGYNLNLKKLILNFESLIRQTNNTGIERCFVDGVEVEFKGAFAEIAEK